MRALVSTVLACCAVAAVPGAAVHLLVASSTVNEVISTVPVLAHGLAFPLPSGMALMLVGIVMMFLKTRLARATGALLAVGGLLLALSVTSIALHSPFRDSGRAGNGNFVMVSWNTLDHFDGDSARQVFGTPGQTSRFYRSLKKGRERQETRPVFRRHFWRADWTRRITTSSNPHPPGPASHR